MVQQLGRYQLLEQLWQDRYGSTHRAVDSEGREVAVRRLSGLWDNVPGGVPDPATQQSMLRRVAAKLITVQHPGVPLLYDLDEYEYGAYLVMELVTGTAFTQAYPVSAPARTRAIVETVQQAAAALDALHGHAIVHGVLTADSILLPEGRPAAVKDHELGVIWDALGVRGRSGWAGGLRHLAPEQVTGALATPRTDQYALARIAYTALTGRAPHPQGRDLAGDLHRIAHEDPPAAHEVRPAVGQAVADVLTRGLRLQAAERFGSCGEFAAALAQAVSALPDLLIDASAVTPVPSPAPARERPWWRLWGG